MGAQESGGSGMPAQNPELRKRLAQAGGAARWGKYSDRDRQALAAERLAEYIRKQVAVAPPLSAEQRDRLALLLRGDAA